MSHKCEWELCPDCTDPEVYPGEIFNNADVVPGMGVQCETCSGSGMVCPVCGRAVNNE